MTLERVKLCRWTQNIKGELPQCKRTSLEKCAKIKAATLEHITCH